MIVIMAAHRENIDPPGEGGMGAFRPANVTVADRRVP